MGSVSTANTTAHTSHHTSLAICPGTVVSASTVSVDSPLISPAAASATAGVGAARLSPPRPGTSPGALLASALLKM